MEFNKLHHGTVADEARVLIQSGGTVSEVQKLVGNKLEGAKLYSSVVSKLTISESSDPRCELFSDLKAEYRLACYWRAVIADYPARVGDHSSDSSARRPGVFRRLTGAVTGLLRSVTAPRKRVDFTTYHRVSQRGVSSVRRAALLPKTLLKGVAPALFAGGVFGVMAYFFSMLPDPWFVWWHPYVLWPVTILFLGLALGLPLVARRVRRNAAFDVARHAPFKCVDVVLLGEID